MSRLNDFINFDDKVFEDIDFLLEEQGQMADVYRRASSSGAGFTSETGTLTKIGRMLVYMVPAKADYRMTASPDLNIPKKIFIGITAEKDVRMRDQWRVGGVFYEVVEINKTPKMQIQVKLEAQ